MTSATQRSVVATPEQATASDPKVSAWVSANAGSGKTQVLVERVLRLLLAGVDPSRILCLTFTRAAAAEMANRVFARLAGWAAASDTALGRILEDIEGAQPPAARIAFARTLFAHALETPGGLKIQTIHAFCERVLHQFAFEANVTAHFRVMDDALAGDLRARAIAATLSHLPDRTDLVQALDVLAGFVGEQRFGDLMRAVIAARQPLAAWMSKHGGLDGALEQLRTSLDVADGDSSAAIMHDWLNSPFLPGSCWGDLAAALSASKSVTDQKHGAALDLSVRASGDTQRLAAYKALLLTAAGDVRKSIGTRAFSTAYPAWADAIAAELNRAAALLARERALEVYAASVALLRLGDAVIGEFEALKKRQGLLDYDDLISRTLSLLSRQDAAPWVLFKLDGGIDHILIDEAQDTNPEQWEIVRLLAEEFFAGEGARGGLRTIFAVGDEKQSIYSFQGAEPAAFERMRRFFAKRIGEATLAFERVNLIVSFRSVPTVLAAVDEVFRLEMARQGLSEVDETIVHTAMRAADPGVVELWPLDRPNDREEKPAWDAPLDRPSRDHPRLRLAQRVAREIVQLTQGETLVERSGTRSILPGDILILVRRRNDLVDALISALRGYGLPVAGADRLVLGEHLAVQDLMAAGDVALLPEDDLTLAAVLKSPLIGLDEDALFTLAWQRQGSLWDALRARQDENCFASAFASISRWMAHADLLRPYEFFSSILTQDGGRIALLERLGPEAADAIDELLSLALAYEETETASLQGFLHWMRGQSIDIKRNMEEGRGEIRIMTVHGAKGLEAPVVFLVDTCDMPTRRLINPVLPLDGARGADSGFLWRIGKADSLPPLAARALDREMAVQLAEYRRLLYVAMTRARDRLYVCGALGDNANDPPEGSWYALVSAALAQQMTPIVDGAGDRLRLGEPPPRMAAATVADDLTQPALPDWMTMPIKGETEPVRPLRPSEIGIDAEEAPSPAPDDSRTIALQRGTFVHRLLELLADVAPEERAGAAHRLAVLLLPDSQEATRMAWTGETLRLFETEALQSLFSARSISEVPLAGTIGHSRRTGRAVTISGQIDRLAVLNNEVLIGDYKTNRMPPEHAEDVPPAYIAQLGAYRAALEPQFPGKTLRFFLIWTATANVMEISPELLDLARERLLA